MTDRMIVRFFLDGQTRENNLVKNRHTAQHALEGMMRDKGYIPLLDLNPDYKLSLVNEEVYEFKLTMQGVYIGEGAWKAAGLVDGKVVWKSTPTPKSEGSSKTSESP